MDALLLGGWRHVASDVRKLALGLEALPEICTCRHGSAHLAGTCPCCLDGERRLDAGCTDCETLLASLRDEIDELSDASLRFLPFVEAMTTPDRNAAQHAQVRELRCQIQHVTATFERLSTAADEFRTGCSSSHVITLRTLAGELATATRHVDSLLTPVAERVSRMKPVTPAR